MMKRKLMMIAVGLILMATSSVYAQDEQDIVINEQELQTLTPTYLDGVQEDAGWDSNWFLSVQGGASAFLGKPIGHADLFDRFQPVLNVSLGKWFTPKIGGRIAYQGLKLKDWQLQKRAYQNVHADFLYNVSSHFRNDIEALPRWDCIPYVGAGIIRNSYTHHKPFAISYGIIGRYRINTRLHVSGELGATNTFQDFDGNGVNNKFGDQLLHASVGLTLTLGKVGWKRVIDANPYIYQNDVLTTYVGKLKKRNEKLQKQHEFDKEALAEMNKILEIEGLLGKYKLMKNEDEHGEEHVKAYPRNDYSGLNSLRQRIRNKKWDGNPDNYQPILNNETDTIGNLYDSAEYMAAGKGEHVAVGSPIFFFFRVNSCEMTEKAQVINIDEIAKVAKKNDLWVKIIGAADSQTGNERDNERLSAQRADCIAKLLRKKGVKDERIAATYEGGINKYEPFTANRNTKVILYIQK